VPEKSLLWEKNLPDKNGAVYGKDFVCFATGKCIGGEMKAVRGYPDPWRVGRWWVLYQTAALVALIPIMSCYLTTRGLAKKILLIFIPGDAVPALGNYQKF
jgi:hypothetical protein